MFIDKVQIVIQSGDGGDGLVSWRREKYVPNGGPAGGDGGRGGSVYMEATESLQTLLDFKYNAVFKAQCGEKGKIKNMAGRSADDMTIKVPCGTVVRDVSQNKIIADLIEPGQRVLIAAGGRGGRGNARFLSNSRRAPGFAEPGEPGLTRKLELELKLIADVGIIGLPNAGKSTFISVISAAKPKIADYPFTTLTPNLGVVKKPSGDGVVVADIPGLIEGASEGAGLGHAFLRHVERTRLLLHLVDMNTWSTEEDEGSAPIERYRLINRELQKYSETLSKRPQLVILTKADALDDDTVQQLRQRFETEVQGPVFVISSVSRQGVDEVLHAMFDQLERLPKEIQVVQVEADELATNPDDSTFTVEKVDNRTFAVHGPKIRRWVRMTNFKSTESIHQFMRVLKGLGVLAALNKAGVQPGDDIRVDNVMFEYYPDEEIEAESMEGFEDDVEVYWEPPSNQHVQGEDEAEVEA